MTYTHAGVECVLACILECVSQKSRQVICDLVEGITEEKGQVHSGLDCKGVGGVRGTNVLRVLREHDGQKEAHSHYIFLIHIFLGKVCMWQCDDRLNTLTHYTVTVRDIDLHSHTHI